VFSPLKDALSGTQFQNDYEVRSAVHEWLRTHPKEFFSCGIYALVKCWRKFSIELTDTQTISFLLLNYLMAWQIKRFTVVALSGQTGEACHKIEHRRQPN